MVINYPVIAKCTFPNKTYIKAKIAHIGLKNFYYSKIKVTSTFTKVNSDTFYFHQNGISSSKSISGFSFPYCSSKYEIINNPTVAIEFMINIENRLSFIT